MKTLELNNPMIQFLITINKGRFDGPLQLRDTAT